MQIHVYEIFIIPICSVFVCIEAENVFKSVFKRIFFYLVHYEFFKHISGSDLNLLVADPCKPILLGYFPSIYRYCYFAGKMLNSDSDEQICFLMFIHYIIYKHFLDSDLNLLADDPNLFSDALFVE